MSHGESHFKNRDKIVYFKAVLLKIEPQSVRLRHLTYFMAICKIKSQTVYFILFYKTTFSQNRIEIVYFTGYFVVWYNKTGIKETAACKIGFQ